MQSLLVAITMTIMSNSSTRKRRRRRPSSKSLPTGSFRQISSLFLVIFLGFCLDTSQGFQRHLTFSKAPLSTKREYNPIFERCLFPSRSLRAPFSVLAAKRGSGGSRKATTQSSKRGSPTNKKSSATKSLKSSPKRTGTPATKQKASSGPKAPPWQVLSKKDAKKNVEREKIRRERVKQGVPHDEAVVEPDEPLTVSKSFLSNEDQSLLGWKRFNPSTTAAGMKFMASVLDRKLPPRLGVPEIAFLGRSNVGKSSLLNRLSSIATKSSGLTDVARVGKTPGATASVNLYGIYDKKEKPILGFVDLPGFGYARLSKEMKESVQVAAELYLGKREELVLGILLVDIRRNPSDDDRAVLAALYDMGVPILVVATKVDKVSKNELQIQLEQIRDGLGLPDGQPFCVSAVTGEGTKQLWSLILEACEQGVEEFRKKQLELGTPEEESAEPVSSKEQDMQDIFYSQGYDWVHGDILYEEDEESFEEMEEEAQPVDDMVPQKETFKSLKQKARRLERGGEV